MTQENEWDLAQAIAEQEAVPKPWWMSRRGVGIAMVVVAQIAGIAGFDIDAAVLTEAVLHAISLGGLAVSYWGWVKAKKPISKRLAPGIGRDPEPERVRSPERPAQTGSVSAKARGARDDSTGPFGF